MAKYFPESAPSPGDIKDHILYEWVFRELNRVSAAGVVDFVMNVEKQFVAPSRPQDGDIAYADGTDWDPGSGAGIYAYIGGAWDKLST